MNLGPYGRMFCSASHFKTCYELFVEEMEKVVIEQQVLESEKPATQTMFFFEVEAKALHHLRAPGPTTVIPK